MPGQPANLRKLATWNVGGWTHPGQARDEKLNDAIRAHLSRGPVALQETHWGVEQPTQLVTLLPGVQIVATPSQTKNTRASGGAAILLPIGYHKLNTHTVLPGRIITAQVELRGAKFRLVSIYLHPDAVKQELHSLLRYLKTLDLREWAFLMGDFSRADALAQEDWHRLLPPILSFDAPPCVVPRGSVGD